MTEIMCLKHDLVEQIVEKPSGSPYSQIVDLAVPPGSAVTGSGAIMTEVYTPDGMGGWIWVAESGTHDNLRVADGPHPSDPSLWRISIIFNDTRRCRIRCWITAIG